MPYLEPIKHSKDSTTHWSCGKNEGCCGCTGHNCDKKIPMTWEEEFEKHANRLTDEQNEFHADKCRGNLHSHNCPSIRMKRHFLPFIQKTSEDAVREVLEKVEDEVNRCDRFCLNTPTQSMEMNDIGAYMYVSNVLSIINKHKNI